VFHQPRQRSYSAQNTLKRERASIEEEELYLDLRGKLSTSMSPEDVTLAIKSISLEVQNLCAVKEAKHKQCMNYEEQIVTIEDELHFKKLQLITKDDEIIGTCRHRRNLYVIDVTKADYISGIKELDAEEEERDNTDDEGD